MASSWRPAAATARWRLADSALSTRLSSPRERPRDLPRLELEERPGRPDPAQERADRLAALPGHDALAAADAPCRGQADVGQPTGEDRRLGERDDELEVRPAAGQAERAAGQEAAAQPGHPAVLGGGRPSRTARRRRDRGRGARRSRDDRGLAPARPRPPGRPPRRPDRTAGPGRWRPARCAGRRRGRGRSLVMPCGPSSAALRPDGLLVGPQDRRGQTRRVVVMGVVGVDDLVEDEPGRGRRARRPVEPDRPRRSSRPARGHRTGRWPARRRPAVGRCGATSASTWPARVIPLVSPACVATLQT